jgi:hypothetical protein
MLFLLLQAMQVVAQEIGGGRFLGCVEGLTLIGSEA